MHEEKEVHCQCFTSAFLGHYTVEKLKKFLLTEIQDLNHKNLINILMDGPNVKTALAIKTVFDREATGLP